MCGMMMKGRGPTRSFDFDGGVVVEQMLKGRDQKHLAEKEWTVLERLVVFTWFWRIALFGGRLRDEENQQLVSDSPNPSPFMGLPG
jgi:hypothetical protein